jgi:hypothetical protein
VPLSDCTAHGRARRPPRRRSPAWARLAVGITVTQMPLSLLTFTIGSPYYEIQRACSQENDFAAGGQARPASRTRPSAAASPSRSVGEYIRGYPKCHLKVWSARCLNRPIVTRAHVFRHEVVYACRSSWGWAFVIALLVAGAASRGRRSHSAVLCPGPNREPFVISHIHV